MMIIGSRPVGQWLGLQSESIEEGSAFDRAVLSALIGCAVVILSKRGIDWKSVFSKNRWLALFMIYCLSSITWSDFPFVAFKRWVKECGNVLMVLVVVTEDDHIEAVKGMVRRSAYILIPLSIVLIKYYPDYGRGFSPWTGEAYNNGVAMSKNMLGNLCLVTALYFVWSLFDLGKEKSKQTSGIGFIIHIWMLGMIFWLFYMSQSATSLICFFAGAAVVILSRLPSAKENPRVVMNWSIIAFAAFIGLEMVFEISDALISSLGRDPTLTGRAGLWEDVLALEANPVVGAGYESFWLGDRLEKLWDKYWWKPIGAHNGYLETYLNLGWIGILLLTCFISATLGQVRRNIVNRSEFGVFRFSVLIAALIYNLSESAFKGSILVWFMLLMISIEGRGSSEST